MRRERRNGKSKTPLDAKQQALNEQQERLRQKMEHLERLIEEAPKRAEEHEKRRREQLMEQSRRPRRSDVPVLLDKRYDLVVPMAPSRRSRKTLKAEKRAARLTFFTLTVVLILILVWLWKIKP